MPVQVDVIYRNKAQIVAAMIQGLQVRIPDAWVEEDGNMRLFFEVIAGAHEGVYLANQLLRDNIWIQRANYAELRLHGEQYGLAIKDGTIAAGLLRFTGSGGTNIPAGTEIGADVGEEDVLHYFTTEDGTLPSPGIPNAPVIVDAAVAGNLPAGAYNYEITFLTPEGETQAGSISNTVTLVGASKINVNSIPLGGAGTIKRRIYRQVNGGEFQFVIEIADNTTTTYLDNIAPGSLGGAPPTSSTAERVSVEGQGEEGGAIYNVGVGAINIVIAAPDGVTAVTNTTAFTEGTDEEAMEDYRIRLLDFVRAPRTGSETDLRVWSEEIELVESATIFPNDNMGTPTNGHVTVRIAGPNGSIPSAGTIAEALAHLQLKDIANMTIHVTTFTANPLAVTVDVDVAAGFTLASVTPSVVDEISKYINDQPVGGTIFMAGIIDAVFGLPGITTVRLTTPVADFTSTAVQKATPGTITVT